MATPSRPRPSPGMTPGNGGVADDALSVDAELAVVFNKFTHLMSKGARSVGNFTVSGARQTVSMTTKVAKKVGTTAVNVVGSTARFVPEGGVRLARAVDPRQLFRERHRQELGTAAADNDGEQDVESSDDEQPEGLLEALYEGVDKRYSNPSYNATRAELDALPATYSEESDTMKSEIAELSKREAERTKASSVVDGIMKKRILNNYNVFLQGVQQISDVRQSLAGIAGECRRMRMDMEEGRQTLVANSIMMPMHRRRVAALRQLQIVTQAMAAVHARHSRFKHFLAHGRFRDAILMVRAAAALTSPTADRPGSHHGCDNDDNGGANNKHSHGHSFDHIRLDANSSSSLGVETHVPNEHLLAGIACMQATLREWHEFVHDPQLLLEYVDRAVVACLEGNAFHPDVYREVIDAYETLNDMKIAVDTIVSTLVRIGREIVPTTLREAVLAASQPADTTSSIAIDEAARMLPPDQILPCLCRVSTRCLDFLLLFSRVTFCHEEAKRRSPQDSPQWTFNAELLELLSTAALHVARTFHVQLVGLLQGLPLAQIDLDKCLHLHLVVMLLVEATTLFCSNDSEKGSARAAVKKALQSYIADSYHPSRASQLLMLMPDESWVAEGDMLPSHVFKVIAPLSTELYRENVKFVKKFVTQHRTQIPDKPPPNPFQDPRFTIVPDIANLIKTLAFNDIDSGLDARRVVISQPSLMVANNIFEYVCRIAVRFPPLANEVLGWCEELVALFVYTVASNFVSTSRGIPLEEQADFSSTGRGMLAAMREMAARAAPARGGGQSVANVVSPRRPSMAVVGGAVSGAAAAANGGGNGTGNSGDYSASSPGANWQPFIWNNDPKSAFRSLENMLALGERVTALESAIPLFGLLRLVLRAVQPLTTKSVETQQSAFIAAMEMCTNEVLQVGMHRFAVALFDTKLTKCIETMGKVVYHGRIGMAVSPHIPQLVADMEEFAADLNKKVKFPSELTKTLFLRQFLFAVQRSLLRGFVSAKKPIDDAAVTQMRVDESTWKNGVAGSALLKGGLTPSHKTYVNSFLVTFFDGITNPQKQDDWLRQNHEFYPADMLVQWIPMALSGDKAKERRTQVKNLLRGELSHTDCIMQFDT